MRCCMLIYMQPADHVHTQTSIAHFESDAILCSIICFLLGLASSPFVDLMNETGPMVRMLLLADAEKSPDKCKPTSTNIPIWSRAPASSTGPGQVVGQPESHTS